MSKKQQIYISILERLLPFMRNIQTHSAWNRFRYGSFYPEMELVHNLHRNLVSPEFTDSDVHWLNFQAWTFYKRGDNPRHGFYKPICKDIAELFSLVPETLKVKLKWQGPDAMKSI